MEDQQQLTYINILTKRVNKVQESKAGAWIRIKQREDGSILAIKETETTPEEVGFFLDCVAGKVPAKPPPRERGLSVWRELEVNPIKVKDKLVVVPIDRSKAFEQTRQDVIWLIDQTKAQYIPIPTEDEIKRKGLERRGSSVTNKLEIQL